MTETTPRRIHGTGRYSPPAPAPARFSIRLPGIPWARQIASTFRQPSSPCAMVKITTAEPACVASFAAGAWQPERSHGSYVGSGGGYHRRGHRRRAASAGLAGHAIEAGRSINTANFIVQSPRITIRTRAIDLTIAVERRWPPPKTSPYVEGQRVMVHRPAERVGCACCRPAAPADERSRAAEGGARSTADQVGRQEIHGPRQ